MTTEPSVYRERAHLTAYLAALHPSVMVLDADPEAPGWPVLYITLPTGQASWHISPDDLDLFHHVPIGTATWDRHDTPEKYRRLDRLTGILSSTVPVHAARTGQEA